jgi:hypothetical protein
MFQNQPKAHEGSEICFVVDVVPQISELSRKCSQSREARDGQNDASPGGVQTHWDCVTPKCAPNESQ